MKAKGVETEKNRRNRNITTTSGSNKARFQKHFKGVFACAEEALDEDAIDESLPAVTPSIKVFEFEFFLKYLQ